MTAVHSAPPRGPVIDVAAIAERVQQDTTLALVITEGTMRCTAERDGFVWTMSATDVSSRCRVVVKGQPKQSAADVLKIMLSALQHARDLSTQEAA